MRRRKWAAVAGWARRMAERQELIKVVALGTFRITTGREDATREALR